MAKTRIPAELQVWIDARKRYRLSDAQVQMARELGLNPRKLGGLANTRQEPWKAPLPEFIEHLYSKRFGRTAPERVRSLEEMAQERERRKVEKRERRKAGKDEEQSNGERSPDA
jgi:hypothetical protein